MELYNVTRGVVLAQRALLADNFLLRMRGLLFRPQLKDGEGLYLVPCQSIHMFGMKYAIDAVFINAEGIIVGVVERIAPGHISPLFISAKGCLEVPAGKIANSRTQLGDLIEIRDCQGVG